MSYKLVSLPRERQQNVQKTLRDILLEGKTEKKKMLFLTRADEPKNVLARLLV